MILKNYADVLVASLPSVVFRSSRGCRRLFLLTSSLTSISLRDAMRFASFKMSTVYTSNVFEATVNTKSGRVVCSMVAIGLSQIRRNAFKLSENTSR